MTQKVVWVGHASVLEKMLASLAWRGPRTKRGQKLLSSCLLVGCSGRRLHLPGGASFPNWLKVPGGWACRLNRISACGFRGIPAQCCSLCQEGSGPCLGRDSHHCTRPVSPSSGAADSHSLPLGSFLWALNGIELQAVNCIDVVGLILQSSKPEGCPWPGPACSVSRKMPFG